MNKSELVTVKLSEDRKYVEILDQTLLPCIVRTLRLNGIDEMTDAIRTLKVRGAPAIGVFAAYALAVASSGIEADSREEFVSAFERFRAQLAGSRPTAVNLFYALDRMEKVVLENPSASQEALLELLYSEASAIHREDIEICAAIGREGYSLLHDGFGILTHCNAGMLATTGYGTATAPVYTALDNGMRDLRVYCDETRPLLQGARLTAFELSRSGVDTTLICDNMASDVMKRGLVDIIFVGCDRVAANGDAANKIGTSGVAVLAKYYGIPFYICAPGTTIDMNTPDGAHIPVEQRNGDEITEMWYSERMAPTGINVYNPAFDVTDHSLITGIITERGICTAPFDEAFKKLGY